MCPIELRNLADDPRLFAVPDLFNRKLKRVSDTDRVEAPLLDDPSDDMSETGTIVHELAAQLKRKKQRP